MGRDDLPDAELEVLAALWHRGESTARQVREALEEFRPMSHGAVFTLLSRLEEKGHVIRAERKIGKAFVYRAQIEPGSTFRKKVRDLLERVFRGSSVSMVNALFETRPPTDDEIRQLEGLLGDLKHRRREGKS